MAEKEKFDRLYDDGEVWCTLVPERTVPAGARCIAADVADRAALRLGIWDDPTLVWFRKADAATAADLDAGRRSRDDVLAFRQRPTIRAFTMRDDPHVVYLDANMPPDNVPHVVAHELRHVWQQQAHRGQYVGQWAEDDAEAFARKFIR